MIYERFEKFVKVVETEQNGDLIGGKCRVADCFEDRIENSIKFWWLALQYSSWTQFLPTFENRNYANTSPMIISAFISPAKCFISGSFDYWRSWSSAEVVWEVFPRGANWPPRSGACCKTDTECTWPSFYPRRSKETDRQIILGLLYSEKSDQKQRALNLKGLPND